MLAICTAKSRLAAMLQMKSISSFLRFSGECEHKQKTNVILLNWVLAKEGGSMS